MQQKGKDLFLDVADGGNDDDLSDDYDDDGDHGICCSQVQQLEAGKVKLEADLNQVGAVLVLFVSALL